MLVMKLSTLAAGLGLLVTLPNLLGVLSPTTYAGLARRFPRHTPVGWILTLLATVWFIHYVSLETNQDFMHLKKLLYLVFGAVGVGTCLFVRDYLPVRGLAALYLLAAKLMVDTARDVQTDWRLVIVSWAYVLVLAGMWFTVSPWRLRDLIQWGTASEGRTRLLCGLQVAFGLLVLALAFTAFRAA
ncbi:MAG: hypothetical protein RJA22_2478 [Verrucomicrobiota bacterium]|jgi:hypothetical protein